MRESTKAFTRVDLLVTVLGLGVVYAFYFAYINTKRWNSHASCTVNLKNLGTSLRVFAEDHQQSAPWEISTNRGGTAEFIHQYGSAFRHYRVLSNYSVPREFVCPNDRRRPAESWNSLSNIHISYFLNVSGPLSGSNVLSGDRNITNVSGVTVSVDRSNIPQWSSKVGLHGSIGNLVFTDGHVSTASAADLITIFSGNKTETLVIP
jgi:prepilin-type processing-associated H-X9-DG protein